MYKLYHAKIQANLKPNMAGDSVWDTILYAVESWKKYFENKRFISCITERSTISLYFHPIYGPYDNTNSAIGFSIAKSDGKHHVSFRGSCSPLHRVDKNKNLTIFALGRDGREYAVLKCKLYGVKEHKPVWTEIEP